MDFKRWSLPIRILIAVVVGFGILELVCSGVPKGGKLSPIDRFNVIMMSLFYGIMLFYLFGWPMIQRVGERIGNSLYMPSDDNFQIMPEYSVAEARAQAGKYQEAVDEYRKVIAEHPDDIYPHLRIAEFALNELNDVKLAELELLSAIAKAKGSDSTALAAGRLADFYQVTLHDPARALEVMKQLREKIPGTKQARLAEERISALEGTVAGTARVLTIPDKIAPRPSRYKMPE